MMILYLSPFENSYAKHTEKRRLWLDAVNTCLH